MKAYQYKINSEQLDEYAKDINAWAVGKGFWNSAITSEITSPQAQVEFDLLKKSQKFMLVVTELAEGVEGIRKPTESGIPGFTNEEEEIADAMIRLFDYSGYYKLRLGEAIAAKMVKNEGRPYMHNKAF